VVEKGGGKSAYKTGRDILVRGIANIGDCNRELITMFWERREGIRKG